MINMRKYRFYRIFTITSILFSCALLKAQTENGMGCVYEPEFDGKALQKAKLLTRDYTSVPQAYSLKQYCPTPKSQEQYGTCTSWATSYAARTICEAISNGWTNTNEITAEAFSPIFVYKNIEDNATDCQHGTSIAKALSLLKTKGAPKFKSFSVLCADFVPPILFDEAQNYKIDDYTKLFDRDYDWVTHQWIDNTPASVKMSTIKKAISQDHPVVIAMNCYSSFSVYGKDLWSGEQDNLRGEGGHAMCVIGYDDDKYGGAFEIMNSWGTYWGHEGFIWVRYDDFCKNTKYAFDVYLKKKEIPKPVPMPKKYCFSGEMYISEKDGGGRTPLSLIEDKGIMHYKVLDSFQSGKKFRLYVSNNEPAWVYIIASDLKNNVNKLFPYAENISANLNYTSNNIAIPDETHEFEFDSTEGTDYFCVLYSQKEMNIDQIVEKIKNASGSFYDKVRNAIEDDVAPIEDIRYIQNNLGFSAKSDKTIVPLIVEVPHKGIIVNYGKSE